MAERLTHVDEQGRAVMVDVSGKPVIRRRAVAETFFHAASGTLDRIMAGDLPKGEALAVARIAGVQAAKRVDALIPLCHTLPLEHAEVSFERSASDAIRIEAATVVTARTGVEMEALTAVNVAALTLWDMTKAIDKDLRIDGTRLVLKEKASPAS
ncbi:MAG: cyclic pyranopterin monophosphate synthase MoaC [Phycisphaerales bacterium]|nr:cyclic pyranopterin monophosphate synthase MoaC [Phycisphaerales bacterium]